MKAVYGFVTILLRVLKELKPDYVAAAFDRREKTFRHDAYDQYKATRVEAPQELYDQIPIVKSVLRAFNIPIIEKKGFEADDIIGTLAMRNAGAVHVTIVSGDKDVLQLVGTDVDVYTMRKSLSDVILYDVAAVQKRYDGLMPSQLIDYKALAGDPSDNIPGVKGIGDKTAIALLQQHKTLERLYQDLESDDVSGIKPRVQQLLRDDRENALLSQKLGRIATDVDCPFKLQDALLSDYDHNNVIALFRELEFHSLIPRVSALSSHVGANGAQQELFAGPASRNTSSATSRAHRNSSAQDYRLVETEEELTQLLKQLSRVREFALDTETDRLSGLFSHCVGISIAWEKNHGYFLNYPRVKQYKAFTKFRKIFEDPNVHKVGHNVKYDLEVLRAHGIALRGVVFDTMIASYLLHAGSRQHSLSQLALREFGYAMQPIEELIGVGKHQKSMKDVPIADVSWYACEDADMTWQLYAPLQARIKECEMQKLLKEIEMPLISVLADMEENGALVDEVFLKKLRTSLSRRVGLLEKKIYHHVGYTFNIASPKQMAEALFQKLQISTLNLKTTKTGVSTSAQVLETLRGAHPVIDLLMQYRELTKLLSTYVDALPKMINERTGRVHTSYNQTIAATGRLSSSDPNLQNIPIRTEEGREIRKSFIAAPKTRLLSIDYSQIELRIVAALSRDEKMIDAFRNGNDIHTATAAEIHGIPLSDVTPEIRRSAKEVNFGVMYGMGAYGLSSRTGISRAEAEEFIERYFASFPKVRAFLDGLKEQARTNGYAENVFGRRRYIPELSARNQQLRRAGERMAVNMPIQGLAADIMKIAMIRVAEALPAICSGAKMILQVHDELVFETPTSDVEAVARSVREIMQTAYPLAVPLEAECKAGKNWGDMKPILFKKPRA